MQVPWSSRGGGGGSHRLEGGRGSVPSGSSCRREAGTSTSSASCPAAAISPSSVSLASRTRDARLPGDDSVTVDPAIASVVLLLLLVISTRITITEGGAADDIACQLIERHHSFISTSCTEPTAFFQIFNDKSEPPAHEGLAPSKKIEEMRMRRVMRRG